MKVRMRDDLALDGYRVPAGLGYSNYDDLHDDFYLSADDLVGAEEMPDPDPDAHPFFLIKLRDGRMVYLIGTDLDWGEA